MSTSARTLQLLSLLQSHRLVAGAELAARLEVSLRTLRRDVDRLRELGYPVQAHRGGAGGYRLLPGASLPPLVLDDDEAVALVVGLQAAADSAVAGTAEASVRALAKVTAVLPARLRRRTDALGEASVPVRWGEQVAGVDPGVLTALAQACRARERVGFEHTGASGTPARRCADPHRLVRTDPHWYLLAHDVDRHDWRVFRLDRVRDVRPTGRAFAPREVPGGDAAEFVRRRFSGASPHHEVHALVDAPAAAVRRAVGRWGRVEEIGLDRCELRVATGSLDWAAFALLRTGASFEVLDPPELREHLAAWAARLTPRAPDPPHASPPPPAVILHG
ncbi:YafY family transcriptional regulator [Paenibacillus sp. TRM 82003]|uniref:helix-turn-helix transcriptional regulator n=1 Tax=Kineococcus sp. TRM81007 TaxID=2925831 RepID=UPI001F579411|nr:YafY family protein [Kineococcus sp. TRM81007]MCI2237426.1 YafY family transcriptional regulator [Kineococcus sp. TRM81007]MCI3919777.1 YafY family transcriptional regulator [Paenibacillus sp. TRM 82003]